MNYLAHIYLSYDNDQIKIGNFIADFVKGNKYKIFSDEIQKGIKLHRLIDSFTDAHPVVRKSKRRLHERYRHYDGVIIDIFMDHFLAKKWKHFSKIDLAEYEINFIELLEKNTAILPAEVLRILPYFKEQRWLSSYATLQGISKTLQGVNKRTKGISKMDLAINDLQENYEQYESDFLSFFHELEKFVQKSKLNL